MGSRINDRIARVRAMACDVALAQATRQAVHREAAGRFAAAIKARDDLALHVDDEAHAATVVFVARVVQSLGWQLTWNHQ